MHPRSPRWRGVLSVLIVVHMVSVVLWVIPASHNPLRPLAGPWIETLRLRQSWSMFADPSHWERYLVTEGLDADGQHIWTLPDSRPTGEPRLAWSPQVKFRRSLGKSGARPKRMTAWLKWACTQAPDEVVRVRAVRQIETGPTLEDRREGRTETTIERSVLRHVRCP